MVLDIDEGALHLSLAPGMARKGTGGVDAVKSREFQEAVIPFEVGDRSIIDEDPGIVYLSLDATPPNS